MDKLASANATRLANHTANHLLGMYHVIDENYGKLHGTGLFIKFGDEPYIISAGHIFSTGMPLAAFGGDGKKFFPLSNPTQGVGDPVDLGLTRLDRSALTEITDRAPIEPSRFGSSQDLDGEAIFLHGYPDDRSRFSPLSNGIRSKSLPYLTEIIPIPAGTVYDDESFIAVAYDPTKALDEDDREVPLPLAYGMSGAPVWATRSRYYRADEWGPEHAQIVGIAHHWLPEHKCIIATRAEQVVVQIAHMLQREAAYFRWLDRGTPQGDDWSDWFGVRPDLERKLFSNRP